MLALLDYDPDANLDDDFFRVSGDVFSSLLLEQGGLIFTLLLAHLNLHELNSNLAAMLERRQVR